MNEKLRVMVIGAHQDDFEYLAGGTFVLLKEHYGERVDFKIITTGRGASGHHEMQPEELFRLRSEEARKSASIIGGTYECLRLLDGSHLPAQAIVDRNLLGGIWNAIRRYEPHFLFTTPIGSDPLSGIHIDHVNTGIAVRNVGYQLCVPHAYPTVDGPAKKRVIMPVIIVMDDPYSGESAFHVSVDISRAISTKEKMCLCHESQVFEWIPWVAGKEKGTNANEFHEEFVARHEWVNSYHDMKPTPPREYFSFTWWGKNPTEEDVKTVFPTGETTEQLHERIERLKSVN